MIRSRRNLVLSAMALIAVTAGAAIAWWLVEPDPAAPEAVNKLLEQTLPDSAGQPQPIAQWSNKVLVVNFWATWCAPCVEEMPELQTIGDEYRPRGVEIVGLGIDSADRIRDFQNRLQIRLPLLVAGATGDELGRSLGNNTGALPFTVLIGADRRIAQRKLGRIRADELRAWLDAELKSWP